MTQDGRDHFPKIDSHEALNAGIDQKGWCIFNENRMGDEIYLTVPGCHGMGNLKNHSIDRNGVVDPSVLVGGSYAGKEESYHAFIVLDNWPKDAIKPAGERFIIYQKLVPQP